jgi:hypothetical protein
MKTIETIQTGIIGAIIGLLSLFGLEAVSAVQTKTDISLLAGLTGGIIFGFLYFVILLLGYRLAQSWRRKLMSGFIYGIFGGMLGQVMTSFSLTASSELTREIVATPLCGLLITLLFFDTNRHIALATLVIVVALVFFVSGMEKASSAIIMATLISVGVWLVSPLVPKIMLNELKEP